MSDFTTLTTTDPDLELYDPLDGSTSGTVTGTTDYEAGLFGRQAFVFNGATRIDYPSITAYQSGAASSLTEFFRFKATVADSAESSPISTGGNNRFAISTTGVLSALITGTTGTATLSSIASGLLDGEWHSVALVATTGPSTSDDIVTVYVDGVSAASTTGNYGPYISGGLQGPRLGQRFNLEATRDYFGSMQDVIFYSRDLIAGEIAALHAGPTATSRRRIHRRKLLLGA